MKHEPTPVPNSTWKWIAIPLIIAIAFMGLLYLAMATEPDYMPANQKKAAGIDPHASHGNAAAPKYTAEEHAQHSETEHAQAIAEETQAATEQATEATTTDHSTNQHGH